MSSTLDHTDMRPHPTRDRSRSAEGEVLQCRDNCTDATAAEAAAATADDAAPYSKTA